jgi:beta-aspartyl-peptidase (threonine type)
MVRARIEASRSKGKMMVRWWEEMSSLAAPALLALAAAGCGPGAGREAGAAAEVRAVLATQRVAWNRGDLDGFMDGYWRSDSLTFESGTNVRRGWEATRAGYVRTYKSEGREMGTLDFDLREVTVQGGEATVRGAWRLTLKAGSPHGAFTLRLRRFPEGWKIVHDHTTSET